MKTRNLTYIAIFCSMISILSIIAIPSPSGVPFTLQTFAVALTGYVLGYKKGTIAVFLYIIIGILGLPVFSGMGSGISRIFSPSGGFILGFIFMAIFCGFKSSSNIKKIFFGIAGLLICHICGVLWFHSITDTPIFASFFVVSMPYLLKDIVSVIVAYAISIKILKMSKINI